MPLTDDPNPIVVTANKRRYSPVCVALIKEFEQLKLKAYMPTPNDRPTLGWGCTFWPDAKGNLRPVRMGMTCTPEEAEKVLSDELERRARALDHYLGDTPTSQPQYDALLSWAFNVGVAASARSTLLRFHKQGRHDAAFAQFHLWIYQAKKRLKGLIVRRAMEAALYMTPEGRDPPWLRWTPKGEPLITRGKA